MFEEFDKSQAPKEGRGRMGLSFLISAGIFIGIVAALAAAIATTRVVLKRRQHDVDVAFVPLPRAPKPKLVKPASPGQRKLAAKQNLRPPTEIPDERPAEAEGELTDAGKLGPVEGFTDGVGDGKGGAPAQETEMVAEPRFVDGCRQPEIPDGLHNTAATINIDVRMLIDERGRVTTATLLTTHPLIPDDLILRCARAQIFRPAHLPDGTAVPYPFKRRFVFKPAGV